MTDEPVLFAELEDQEEFFSGSGERTARFRKDKSAPLTSKYPFVNAVWVEPNEGKACFFKKDAQCYRVPK